METAALGCLLATAAGCAAGTGSAPRSPTPAPVPFTAEERFPPPPATGYAWDDLARRAAARSGEARAGQLDSQALRHQTDADTAWPDPQLRLAARQGDADDTRPGSALDGDRRSSDGFEAGLRFPLPHPFATPWLRRRGAAEALARDAEARETANAIFHEVRALCLEAAALETELEWLEQIAALRAELRDIRSRQTAAGFADALGLIQAVTRAATLREDLRDTHDQHQRLLARIALLAHVPADRLRLRPLAAEPRPDPTDAPLDRLLQRAEDHHPGLERLRHEANAAAHEFRAARSAALPWFDYIEASYQDESTRIVSPNASASASLTDRDAAEWQLRVALSLPVWGGHADRPRSAQLRQAAAQLRLDAFRADLRANLTAVHAEAQQARTDFDRLAAEHRQVLDLMESKLAGFADEPSIRPEDLLAAREAVAAYSRILLRADLRLRRHLQQLEALCGNPPEYPAPPSDFNRPVPR